MAHTLSADTLADDVEVEAGKDKLVICTNRFKKKGERDACCLPVLVDHVGNSETIVNNLAPSVSVEELGAQLGGGQVPRGRVGVGGILVDLGQLLAGLEKLLQTEQMTVDTVAGTSLLRVLGVLGEGSAEELDGLLAGGGVVFVSLAEGDALVGDGAGCLCAAFGELAGGGGLVCGTVLAVHLEVGQLDGHLDEGIGAALELLDETLAVALIGLDNQLVRADLLAVVLCCEVDGLIGGVVQLEVDGLGVGELGAHGLGGEIEFLVEDDVVDIIVQAVGGSTVHHAVLTHETSGAIVVDNELQRLIEPAVGAITVPVLRAALSQSDGASVVQADHKASRLNLLQGQLIGRVKRNEGLASSSPVIAVGNSQHTNGRRRLGDLVDALELLLQLRDIELLTVHHERDLEELVLAHRHDVLVIRSGVLAREIRTIGRDTAAVEHVLVRAHGLRLLTEVLGLQGAIIDLGLEVESSSGNGSSALGWVATLAVVPVGVEVGDVRDDGVAVSEVGGLVPPLGEPVLDLRVGGASQETLLQRLTLTTRADELLHGLLGALILGLGDDSVDGLEVPTASLF
jgi:hypothetical protein